MTDQKNYTLEMLLQKHSKRRITQKKEMEIEWSLTLMKPWAISKLQYFCLFVFLFVRYFHLEFFDYCCVCVFFWMNVVFCFMWLVLYVSFSILELMSHRHCSRWLYRFGTRRYIYGVRDWNKLVEKWRMNIAKIKNTIKALIWKCIRPAARWKVDATTVQKMKMRSKVHRTFVLIWTLKLGVRFFFYQIHTHIHFILSLKLEKYFDFDDFYYLCIFFYYSPLDSCRYVCVCCLVIGWKEQTLFFFE